MKWEVIAAKNGEQTLLLNDICIYSKYRPQEDAWKWVENEFDPSSETYLLIGLGLGYHAERLQQLANDKKVIVYYFEKEEYAYFVEQNEGKAWITRIEIVQNLNGFCLDENVQVLIPNNWLKALGTKHLLFPFLEDIKIKQITYKKSATLMEQNFHENLQVPIQHRSYPKYTKKIACLVASGPTLNKTINWLQEVQEQVDIFVVGSALNLLLKIGIIPSATVISDAKQDIIKQIEVAEYNGVLYYLSTANAQAVAKHKGESYIMFQYGYPLAEQAAKELQMPLLETGGSVSTVTISMLEYLGFEKIILFGQDLGFAGNQTHAQNSTSGRMVQEDLNLREIPANDGTLINTTPNLQVYARWIEQKAKRMTAQLYTTSQQGAYIPKVSYLNEEEFRYLINSQ